MRLVGFLIALLFFVILFVTVGVFAYARGARDTRTELAPRLSTTQDALKKEYYRAVFDTCLLFDIDDVAGCNAGISLASASLRWYEEPSPGFIFPPLPPPLQLPANPQN